METFKIPQQATNNTVSAGNTIANNSQLQTNPYTTLDAAFQGILSGNAEESDILRTRTILGDKGKSLSDEQVECIVTEFQFLINSWLDEFEKEVLNGMTLREVLNET